MAMAAGCFRSDPSPRKAEPTTTPAKVARTSKPPDVDRGSKHVEVADSAAGTTKRRLATSEPDRISLPPLPPPARPKVTESMPQHWQPIAHSAAIKPIEPPPAVPARVEPAALNPVDPGPGPASVASTGPKGGDPGLHPNPLRTNEVPAAPTRVVQAEPAQPSPGPSPTTRISGPVIGPAPAEKTATPPAVAPSGDPSSSGASPASLPDPAKPWGKGKHSGVKFNPVKENGEIFKDWPTPQFALLISGRQEGYLEPCGCAGLDRMKGGLSRRYGLCQQLRGDGGPNWPKGPKSPWPLVAVDVGGQVKGYDQQAVFKFQATAEALAKMGYDAVGLGVGELRLPAGDVLVAALDFAAAGQGRFVSANVGVLDEPGKIAELPVKRIVSAGGKKIGITAVLGKNAQSQINNSGLQMSDPAAALPPVVAQLKAQQCDLLVLLCHASEQDTVALARQFPDFDVVVTAGGPPEPPNDKQYVPGTKTLLVTTGEKGMNVIVLGFYNDPQNPIRYQRVPLDSRFETAPEITLVMRNYEAKIENLVHSISQKAKPTHPRAELLGRFVGSEKCKECHEGSYKTWLKTPHSRAWETLKSKTNPPRTFDPECISCHAIGWNTTQFFPYESGFQNEKETPQLTNVGCESCHGPGERHILAEKSKDLALQKKLEDAMILTKEEAEKRYCFTCHDGDNSPDFDFKTYWPFIVHKDDK
jgi:hypothetical protein